MTAPDPRGWQDPYPPTDPGSAADTHEAPGPHWLRWGWVIAALFVVLAVLLALVLNQLRHPAPSPDAPVAPDAAAPPVPAGPGQPVPTLPVTFGGFHYTVGISTFSTALTGPGTGPAAPGRHFLVALLAVRNDQTAHAINFVTTVSDCDNDPRNARNKVNPPSVYQGLPNQTCTVATNVSPEHPVTSFEDDSTMAPGATTYAIVRTIDLPDDVPTPHVDVSLADNVAGTVDATYYVCDRIPAIP